MNRVFARLCCLASLISLLSAADITLESPGWTQVAPADAKTVFTVDGNAASIVGDAYRYSRLERPCTEDGTDARPLRIETRLALVPNQEFTQQSALLTLVWPKGMIAVGAIPTKRDRGRERSAVVRWIDGDLRGENLAAADLFRESCPAWARIVVTSRDVSAWISPDGWSWQLLKSMPRNGGFAGAPAKLAIGLGWPNAKQPATLDADLEGRGKPTTITCTFSDLTVTNEEPRLPASLLKSYSKGDSREDTQEKLLQASWVRQWWLMGPLPASRDSALAVIGPEQKPFDAASTFQSGSKSLPWVEHRMGDGPTDYILSPSTILDMRNRGQGSLAAFTIESDGQMRERLLFDGMTLTTVFVNGRPIAQVERERSENETEPDRHSVVTPLVKGRNTVMVWTTNSDQGRSAFSLRREPGDPRYRIALLQRMALDFPDDVEAAIAAHMECARLWEQMGFSGEAAKSCATIVNLQDAPRDLVEAALLERTRLHANLRDDAAVSADIAAIKAHWAAEADTDPLLVHRRTAQLLIRIGQTGKALESLGEAARLDGLTDEQRTQIGLERLRILAVDNQPAAIRDELLSIAQSLTPGNALRSELAAEILDRSFRLGQQNDTMWQMVLESRNQRALRRAFGIASIAGDKPRCLALLRALAELPPAGGWDAPQVLLAETLAASGDNNGAAAAYRKACSALPAEAVNDAKDIDALRALFIRATLAESASGAVLLNATRQATPANASISMAVRDWWTIGPFDNANWSCYDNPPVSAKAVDTSKPVDGKAWKRSESGSYDNDGVLDLKAIYQADNCVVFCYTEFSAPANATTSLSMGADDGLVVWLNGVKVHEDRDARGVAPNSITIPITITKGVNRLLCMVQNGNGGHAVQCHIGGGPGSAREQDLAQLLQRAIAQPERRSESAEALRLALNQAISSDRNDDALALARTLSKAFPDQQGGASINQMFKLLDGDRLANDPASARLIARWIESQGAMHPSDDDSSAWLSDLRMRCASALLRLGDFANAATMIKSSAWGRFDQRQLATYNRRMGDLLMLAGYQDRAIDHYRQVVSTDGIDQLDAHLARDTREQLDRLRRTKEASPVPAIPFDAMTALRTAERSIESKDFARAISAFQQAIAANPGLAVPLGGGRFQGLVDWCTERIRRFPPEGVDVYRSQTSGPATLQLQAAIAADDLAGLERVVGSFPMSAQAGAALERIARMALASDASSFAAATIERLVDDFQVAGPLRGELLAAGLRAVIRQGDHRAFSRLAKRFTASPTIEVEGTSVDTKSWLKDLVEHVQVTPDPALTTAIGSATHALPPDFFRDVFRFSADPSQPIHTVPQAGVADGIAYVNTGTIGVLLDLATGRERWRTSPAPTIGSNWSTDGFSGLPDASATISGNLALARVRSGGRWNIEAHRVSDGRLAWSSEGRPELAGWTAQSGPSADGLRAFASFTDGSRLIVVALDLQNGRPVWITPLSMPRSGLQLQGSSERGQDVAPPTVSGRELFIASDGGAIVSLDAGSGIVRWIATYPRTAIDLDRARLAIDMLARRPVSRVMVNATSIAVMPRDMLGLLCLSRQDGSILWQHEFSDGRSLVGWSAVPGGERLILQGDEVQSLDGNDGRVLWRWRAGDGAILGRAAIGKTTLAVATSGYLHRLALVDGRVVDSRPWKSFGITGSIPANLTWAGNRLVACGNGGTVILAPGGSAMPPQTFTGTLDRSESSSIAMVGLQASPMGSPLGVAWRLPCSQITALVQPDDPTTPGELLVVTRDRLIRLDALAPSVTWSSAIPSDSKKVLVDGDGVFILGRATIMGLSRNDGSLRWCQPIDEDALRSLAEDYQPQLSLGDGTVLLYRPQWGNSVDVLDRRTGRKILHIQPSEAGILAATERKGIVTVAVRRKGKAFSEQYQLDTGANLSKSEIRLGTDNLVGTVVPLTREIILSGRGTALIDTVGGQAKVLNFQLPEELTMRRLGDELEISGRHEGNDWKWSLWRLPSEQLAFQEQFHNGWGDVASLQIRSYRRSGDLLAAVVERNNQVGVLAKNLDGKERWWRPYGESWRRQYWQLAVHPQGVLTLCTEDRRIRAEVLSVADGKVLASSEIPFHPAVVAQAQLIGDTWVIPGEGQLFALRPIAKEEQARIAADEKADGASRYLRGITRIPAAGPVNIMPLSATRSSLDEPAEIRRWKTLGPISPSSPELMLQPPFDPAQVDPSKPAGGLSWVTPKEGDYQPGWLDLTSTYPGSHDCAYYCLAELSSSSDATGILSMGADDALAVWVNGKRIYNDAQFRGVNPNSIEIPVSLRKGRNTIVCAVYNGGGPGGIQCQVVTFAKSDQDVTSSWFQDWNKLPPLILGSDSVLAGAPGEAKATFAADSSGLWLAVEVRDGTPWPRPPGGSPLSGDGVLIGIDLQERERESPVVLSMHDPDGRPQLDLIRGSWANDPAQVGSPVVHVVRGVGRQVYLAQIPWGLLRRELGPPAQQTAFALGLAVIDWSQAGPGIRTWGTGLVDGYSPASWPGAVLMSGK